MITFDELKELSQPPGEGKAYYRPLICKGELDKADIFFVGTNPATPIYQENVEQDAYVELLLNYNKFIEFYKGHRISKGKTEVSRTRMGMNSFIDWLSIHTSSSIIETEAIPYPTDKLKALWKEPKTIIERGKNIFADLILKFEPKLIILHGKETVEQALDILIKREISVDRYVDLQQPIESMEEQVPLFTITYSNGKKGAIAACRHFMYYGSKGDSFSGFRERLLALLKTHAMHYSQ
jgi:hypothetical protein